MSGINQAVAWSTWNFNQEEDNIYGHNFKLIQWKNLYNTSYSAMTANTWTRLSDRIRNISCVGKSRIKSFARVGKRVNTKNWLSRGK